MAAGGEDGWPVGHACPLQLTAVAERHLTRRLFGSMLGRIAAFPSPAGLGESLIGTKPRGVGGRGRKSV